MTITVYAKRTGCQQCIALKRALDAKGIIHSVTYADESDDAREFLGRMGVTSVPAVFEDGVLRFIGFLPDEVAKLASAAGR